MQLSKHFTLQEFTKSQTATRLGLKNQPSPEHIVRLEALCENVLEPVRVFFNIPFSPSSGYRSPELCKAIESKPTSQHARGEAVDFEVPGLSNRDVAQWIVDNLNFDQLILEFYEEGDPNSGWIHVSYVDGDKNRKEVLTLTKENGYQFGLPS
jgi:zinc D-Ala-D-Ala carboxypeptidase